MYVCMYMYMYMYMHMYMYMYIYIYISKRVHIYHTNYGTGSPKLLGMVFWDLIHNGSILNPKPLNPEPDP